MTSSGEQFAHAGPIKLCHETFGDPSALPMLLVMGLASQMVIWDDEFCEQLADRGFWVIRFDNRDIGRSTILRDRRPPKTWQLMVRDRRGASYTLDDMADDAIGLLDHLAVRKAHIVGVSMGGMIAQLIAIRHRERVLSLVSIMSTTGNRRVGRPIRAFSRTCCDASSANETGTSLTLSRPTAGSVHAHSPATPTACAPPAAASSTAASTPRASPVSSPRSSPRRTGPRACASSTCPRP